MRRVVYAIFLGSAPAVIGTVLLTALLLFIAVGPFIFGYDPNAVDASSRLLAPSTAHPFGTDEVGRDIFTRLAVGGWPSLATAMTIVAVSAGVGLVVGSVAGYLGGVLETVVKRVADGIQAFPTILAAVLITYALRPGMVSIAIALSFCFWPYYAKIARGLALPLRRAGYVESALVQGSSSLRIVVRHIVPTGAPAILTQATIALSEIVIFVGGLSFLGLGVREPTAEWGAMIAGSKDYVFSAPWYGLFPGLIIVATGIAFNLLGDSMREHFEGSASGLDEAAATIPSLPVKEAQ